jgi:hypothetical protein
MLVTISHGRSYAPCMAIIRPVSEKWCKRIREHMLTNDPYAEDHPDYETTLIYEDEVEEYIPARKRKEWNDGWDVTVQIDTFTCLSLFGYDANTLA